MLTRLAGAGGATGHSRGAVRAQPSRARRPDHAHQRDGAPTRRGSAARRARTPDASLSPVVDGDVVPRAPLDATREGAGAEVEVLFCTNRDEGQLFLAPTGVLERIDHTILEAAAQQLYGLTADGLATYRANRPDATPGRILSAMWGDHSFWVPPLPRPRPGSARGRRPGWPVRRGGRGRQGRSWRLPRRRRSVRVRHHRTPSSRRRIGADLSPAACAACMGPGSPSFPVTARGWAPYELERRPTAVFTDTIAVVDDLAGDQRRAWAAATGSEL